MLLMLAHVLIYWADSQDTAHLEYITTRLYLDLRFRTLKYLKLRRSFIFYPLSSLIPRWL